VREEASSSQPPASRSVAADGRVGRPFFKWLGSKRVLAPRILDRFIAHGGPGPTKGRWLEPFVGSGAVYFEFIARGCQVGAAYDALLSDGQEDLLATLAEVQGHAKEVSEELKRLPTVRHAWLEASPAMRASFNAGRKGFHPCKRAAWFLWLGRAAYNGLFRINASGLYNMAPGSYEKLSFPSGEALEVAGRALRLATIADAPIPWREMIEDIAAEGDWLYVDPPYIRASKTTGFASYVPQGFSMDDQEDLAAACGRARKRGVLVVASNSDLPVTRALWEPQGFALEEASVRRAISIDPTKRGMAKELLMVGAP